MNACNNCLLTLTLTIHDPFFPFNNSVCFVRSFWFILWSAIICRFFFLLCLVGNSFIIPQRCQQHGFVSFFFLCVFWYNFIVAYIINCSETKQKIPVCGLRLCKQEQLNYAAKAKRICSILSNQYHDLHIYFNYSLEFSIP